MKKKKTKFRIIQKKSKYIYPIVNVYTENRPSHTFDGPPRSNVDYTDYSHSCHLIPSHR